MRNRGKRRKAGGRRAGGGGEHRKLRGTLDKESKHEEGGGGDKGRQKPRTHQKHQTYFTRLPSLDTAPRNCILLISAFPLRASTNAMPFSSRYKTIAPAAAQTEVFVRIENTKTKTIFNLQCLLGLRTLPVPAGLFLRGVFELHVTFF